MVGTRTACLLAVLVPTLVLAPGCTSDAVYDGTKAGSAPLGIVKRLAVPEAAGSPTGRLAKLIVEELDARNAAVTFEPAWDDRGPDPRREADLAASVADGSFAFGLIAARAFDRWPEASLPALSAPFQLHSMAQATAVATDPAVLDYLMRLEGLGLVGIAVIPEEIRHPAALTPLLEPEQFQGLRIRTAQTDVTFEADVLAALGATAVGDAPPGSVLLGVVDASETSFGWLPTLPGDLTITGDLDLWVKFDVLVADHEAWDSLSETQRHAIQVAAARVAAAPIDPADAATRACLLGYRLAVAGSATRHALEGKAEPLVRSLLADSAHAPVVQAMKEAVTEHPAPEYEPPAACRPPTGDSARPDD
ncbi:hypothetical protein ACLQ2Q_15995 [Microbacterium sp. DT81.1]|uniref:hypothetical protein n=1 Tax=Microbacterium sp. DT81.1 TaxID=3393413 RepID=UPI003CE8D990